MVVHRRLFRVQARSVAEKFRSFLRLPLRQTHAAQVVIVTPKVRVESPGFFQRLGSAVEIAVLHQCAAKEIERFRVGGVSRNCQFQFVLSSAGAAQTGVGLA